MSAKPTLVYTWALSGTATAPTLGKQASGWAVGERPPAPTENWLNQANGAWITYLDGVFTDYTTTLSVGSEVGTQIALGNNRARLRVDEYTGALGIADVVLTTDAVFGRFNVQGVRTGRVELNDAGGINTDVARLELSADSPETGLDTFVEFNTNGGNPCYVRSFAFSPTGSQNDAFTAAVMPLDEIVCEGNFVKAHCEVRVTLSGGVFSVALEGTGYNVGVPSYPTTTVFVPITDNANVVGQIRAAVRQTTGSTSVLPFAISGLTWNSGAGRIEFVPEQLTGGAWQPFHIPATPDHEIIVSLTLY